MVKNRKKSTNNLTTLNDGPDNNNHVSTSTTETTSHIELSIINNELENEYSKIQNVSLYSSNSTANTSMTLQSALINNNNNLLNVSGNDQDQIRRCSHDPNIEKLHKSFFKNVKLGVSHATSSHISSSSSLSQPAEIQLFETSSKIVKKSILNGPKKLSIKNKNKTAVVTVKAETSSSENPSSTIATKTEQSIDDTDSNDIKLELESTEQSDVLNEISKVNKWLRDNKNHHKTNAKGSAEKDSKAKKVTKLPSITISEDEDNFNSVIIASKTTLSTSGCKKSVEETTTEVKTKSSFETNDSAIDIRSYGYVYKLECVFFLIIIIFLKIKEFLHTISKIFDPFNQFFP